MAVATTHLEAPRRLALNQLGLWLFFGSESFLFGALASARFILAGTAHPGVNQPLGLVISSVLLTSSVTAYLAEAAMARGDRVNFLRYVLATIALGVLFVAGVGIEWTTAEFELSEPFGTAFFSMTGMHAAHVVSGIVMLALVGDLARRGHFSAESHWGVEATIKYWHFVDVVWVFFYPTLYLVGW